MFSSCKYAANAQNVNSFEARSKSDDILDPFTTNQEVACSNHAGCTRIDVIDIFV